MSELEIAARRWTRNAIGAGAWQQAQDSAQGLPRRSVQGGVGTDKVADHIPGSHVERAFRGRAHCQRNRTLWAERNTMRGRLLPRLDSNRLREHVEGNRFVSRFERTITAKTMHGLQVSLARANSGP